MRFEAELPEPPVPALDCNCSDVQHDRVPHIMVPHEQFELLTGRDRAYQLSLRHPVGRSISSAGIAA